MRINFKPFSAGLIFTRCIPNWVRRSFKYALFAIEFITFKREEDARFPGLSWRSRMPCLDDRNQYTTFDKHYVYHPAWAARVLAKTMPTYHVDISSSLSFSTILSAFLPVKFYDYRPARIELSNLQTHFADLMNLPFSDGELESVSCMHVIEHIGLGRYGDPQDVSGDIKALLELKRIIKSGGDFLLVVPLGIPKIVFNAHRIYSYEQIIAEFDEFELKDFSLITDDGNPYGIVANASAAMVSHQKYGCGCFWFRKL